MTINRPRRSANEPQQTEEDLAPPGTVTPPEYTLGWVRHDPVTLSVAVRTRGVDPNFSWGIMTVDRGGYYGGWSEVQTWTDQTDVTPPAP